MTKAFHAASHGRMKLDKKDYYEEKEINKPLLAIEYEDDSRVTRTVASNDQQGEISREFTVYTISNPVYARSTSRTMGAFATKSAELYIQDIMICDIPEKTEVAYKVSDAKNELGNKDTQNLASFFKSLEGLRFIVENKDLLDKCIRQKKLIKELRDLKSETADVMKLKTQNTLEVLIQKLCIQFDVAETDAARYLLQIILVFRSNQIEIIQKALNWAEYEFLRELINQRIREFNTTNQILKTKAKKGKLVIEFGRADKMSNGERDVLNLVVSLAVFEASVNRKPGILVIDEVFDYLDGANLLAAHYYLSSMLGKMRKNRKIIFLIIMTHLDPTVFQTYCFKGMKVHYLTNRSLIDLNDKVVKLLILRSKLKDTQDGLNISKYLLHYHTDKWELPPDVLSQLPNRFWTDSYEFRDYAYREVRDCYLQEGNTFNALAVIIALRMKVEEITVDMLPSDKIAGYYEQHGSNHKLPYAEECGCDLPEVFYLLEPLYNNAAHLYDGEKNVIANKNRIEDAYVKLSSKVVKKMITEVFS